MNANYKRMKPNTLRKAFQEADPGKKVYMISRLLPDIDNDLQYTSVFDILGAKGIQLTIIEALRMAIEKEDSRLMGTIINKILPSMKGLEVRGGISHNHTMELIMKQLDNMSEEEMKRIVEGDLRKRAKGKLPVPADYKVLGG